MRVLLLRPPTINGAKGVLHDAAPPVGVAYIAGSLEKAGHHVQVIDALGEGLFQYERIPNNDSIIKRGLSDQEILDRIPEDLDFVGVSCMFSVEWPYNRALIKKIRKLRPNVTIAAGGEHITATPAFSLEDCAALDFILRGEGEETVVDLVDALEKGRALETVDGLGFRQADGQVYLTPPRKRIMKVEDIPRPAWHLIPIEQYLDNGISFGVNIGRTMPIVASRGCPYQCTFCSNPVMWTQLWRVRPPQDVVDEIMYYMERYNATNFDFYDLTAIVKKEWVVEMATLLIEKKLNITWQLPSGTRSEAIDEEVCGLLHASGCRYLNYAPESGSEFILKKIKKVIKIDRMLHSMKGAVKAGLSVKANILLGFPGETYRHVLETYWFIIRLAALGIDDVGVFSFTPYPGSALFNELVENGAVTMGDEHLISLAQYADPSLVKSYSEHISDQALRLLCLMGMALFYATNFVLRPARFCSFVRNLVLMQPRTKLEVVLNRIRGKLWGKLFAWLPAPQQPETEFSLLKHDYEQSTTQATQAEAHARKPAELTRS